MITDDILRLRADILELADVYRAHRDIELSTLSTWIMKDGKRFAHWANNGGLTLISAARCMQWFADHWPSDLAWPSKIKRPEKSKEAA